MPGSISSVIRALTRPRRVQTPAELMALAIAAHPPLQRARDDEAYLALFTRLATVALRAFRQPVALPLAITAAERRIVTEELSTLLNGVAAYVQGTHSLRDVPHLEIRMRPQDAIEVRVMT